MRKFKNNFYLPLFWIITGIALIGLCSDIIFAQSNFLQMEGLRSNHQGLARWNADGTGPEPTATGHRMINGLSATYYFSTVDYDSIKPQATSGFTFTGIATGFSNFINALTSNGFSSSDVTVKFGLYDLGNDSLGVDWWVNGNKETWKLESEQDILVQVNREDMVSAPAPWLRTVLDFGTLEWSVESDTFFVENCSANSSVAVQDIAAAFLSDLHQLDSGLRLVRPMALNTNESSFSMDGRSGSVFDTGVWRIEMIDSPTGIDEYSSSATPHDFELYQNYPNPFNPGTTISYWLQEPTRAKVTIYNQLGQHVITLFDGEQRSGYHTIQWDGKNRQGMLASSGVYFYQIKASNRVIVRKMVLMR